MTSVPSTGSAATATVADPVEQARAKALAILDRNAQSCGQLREKLVSRGCDPDAVEHLIARYLEIGLLDDYALAATIALTRHRERGASRRAIRMELTRKGFEPDAIDQALGHIHDGDEYQAAVGIATEAWQRTATLPAQVRARRVMGKLARKGYSPALAYEVVKSLADADTDSA